MSSRSRSRAEVERHDAGIKAKDGTATASNDTTTFQGSSTAMFARRGSESTQRFTRQLFRRPSEPCWSPANGDVNTPCDAVPPSIPRHEKIDSLHFSISSFGDWFNDSEATSPLTTPEESTFGGQRKILNEGYRRDLRKGLSSGLYCDSEILASSKDDESYEKSDGRDGSTVGHERGHIPRRESSLSLIEQVGVAISEPLGEDSTAQGAVKERKQSAHDLATRQIPYYRKPSWLLQGSGPPRLETPLCTREKTSEILQGGDFVATPLSIASPSLPVTPQREQSHSSISSSASVSEFGSSCYNFGAAAKPRLSRKTSITSVLSFNLESDTESSVEVLKSKPTPAQSQQEEVDCLLSPQTQPTRQTPISKKVSNDSTHPLSDAVRDDTSRRARIVLEIITTEETYTTCLEDLVDIYISPAKDMDGVGQPHIPTSERRQVFTNVEAILEFHRSALLPALRTAAEPLIARCGMRRNDESEEDFCALTAKVAEDVAKTFERHAAFFRMYTSYVNNVDSAQRRVQAWQSESTLTAMRSRFGTGRLSSGASMLAMDFRNSISAGSSSAASLASQETGSSQNLNTGTQSLMPPAPISLPIGSKERKRIRAFLQKARTHPRHTQISLEAYLLLPVQRIPRYRLLLGELVRFCPSERLQNANAIVNALESISDIASSMNESKRQSEMDRRLLHWQERIRGTFPSPLVQPHRKLVKDGALVLQRIASRITPSERPSSLGSRSSGGRRGSTAGSSKSGTSNEFIHGQSPSFPAVMSFEKGLNHYNLGTGNDTCPGNGSDTVEDTVRRSVEVLLCNDIVVIVEEAGGRGGEKGSLIGSGQSSLAAVSARMDLVAVLRMCTEVAVIDETVLRIVDPAHVIYLEAQSAQEAIAWQQALHCVAQRASYGPALPPIPSFVVSAQCSKQPTTTRSLRQVKSHQILSKARSMLS